MKVWLDDKREAPKGWIRCYWPEEVIEYLKTGLVTHLGLDHDLGEPDGRDGSDVVLWLQEQVITGSWSFPIPVITCQSDNPPGKRKILLGVDSINRWAKKLYIPTK